MNDPVNDFTPERPDVVDDLVRAAVRQSVLALRDLVMDELDEANRQLQGYHAEPSAFYAAGLRRAKTIVAKAAMNYTLPTSPPKPKGPSA